jgi:hypothetical protein
LPARFALWIDTLHREAGQILHFVFPQRPVRSCMYAARRESRTLLTDGCWRDSAPVVLWCQVKRLQYVGVVFRQLWIMA